MGGDGDPEAGAAVSEHVFDPVRRVGRVHGDEYGAGAGGGPHRGDLVDGPGQRERDDGVRGGSPGEQQAGQRGGAGVEIPVGQGGVSVDDGETVRVGGDGVVEQLRPHSGGAARRAGGGRPRRAFGVGGQVDVAVGDGGVGGDGAEEPYEPVGEPGDGVPVEQVGGVDEGGVHASGGVLAEEQFEVEVAHLRVELDALDGQVRQFQGGAFGVVELEGHLEQRRMGGRAGRFDRLDDTFERQIGVGERLEVVVGDGAQQVGERCDAGDAAAQHDGVDEHADQVVECAVATPGDRGSDGDVVAAGQVGQQHGEGGVHGHEQRGAVRGRQPGEFGVQIGIDREPHDVATERLLRRARPVGGQGEHVG